MTPEEIEAEFWAYHYDSNSATVEFDDDDEGAAMDYLAQVKAEAEAEEAAATARGEAPEPVAAGEVSETQAEPATAPTEDPDAFYEQYMDPSVDASGIPEDDWADVVPPMKF